MQGSIVSVSYTHLKKVAKESVNMLIKLINDQPLKKREVLVPVKYKKGDTL